MTLIHPKNYYYSYNDLIKIKGVTAKFCQITTLLAKHHYQNDIKLQKRLKVSTLTRISNLAP